MVVSFTFLELGQNAISTGRGWLTCAVLRSSVISLVQGGWSHCLRKFLERQLLGVFGLCTAGCPITVGGVEVMLFAKLSNLLSDGDGLRQAFDWRGASGMKPCFKHFNVYKKVQFAEPLSTLLAATAVSVKSARPGTLELDRVPVEPASAGRTDGLIRAGWLAEYRGATLHADGLCSAKSIHTTLRHSSCGVRQA